MVKSIAKWWMPLDDPVVEDLQQEVDDLYQEIDQQEKEINRMQEVIKSQQECINYLKEQAYGDRKFIDDHLKLAGEMLELVRCLGKEVHQMQSAKPKIQEMIPVTDQPSESKSADPIMDISMIKIEDDPADDAGSIAE